MSILLNSYQNLKGENEEKIYLFKSGIFYVALNEDAKKLSSIFNFKITNLNQEAIKVGFPEKKLLYYTNILENCNIQYEIVSNISNQEKAKTSLGNNEELNNLLNIIKNLDLNDVTFKKAYEYLEKIQKSMKE